MITPEFVRTMSRYNRWQNRQYIGAAQKLEDTDRWRDRGTFFQSIAQTLNHVLWDDRIWLARLRGDRQAEAEIAAKHPYTETPGDWAAFVKERTHLDDTIVALADAITEATLASRVVWRRGSDDVETTCAFNVMHMFNHQTHHRGQVHAMLTDAGVDPGSTDLQMLEHGEDLDR